MEALKDVALRTHQKLFVLWPFGLVLCKAKESIKIIRRMWDQGKCYRRQTFTAHSAAAVGLNSFVFFFSGKPILVSDHLLPSLAAIPAMQAGAEAVCDTNFLPWKIPSFIMSPLSSTAC